MSEMSKLSARLALFIYVFYYVPRLKEDDSSILNNKIESRNIKVEENTNRTKYRNEL